MAECIICGERIGDQKTYCSESCKMTAKYARRRKKRRQSKRGEKKCWHCGEKYQPSWANWALSRYCSIECRRRAKCERKKVGADAEPYWLGSQRCKLCGTEYKLKFLGQKYCSRDCAFSDIAEWTPRTTIIACLNCDAKILVADAIRGCCSDRCYQQFYIKTCDICGCEFEAKSKVSRLCSDDCRSENNRRLFREKEIQAHRHAGKEVRCKVCNVLFCPLYGHGNKQLCSEKCAIRNRRRLKRKYGNNAIQRAKYHNVRYKRFNVETIFERDGWHCYICGVSTPKLLRGTYEDNAPEADHIFPLSKGGWHVKSNVACCCRKCNIEKRDMTLSEYLEMKGQSNTCLAVEPMQKALL